LISRKEVRVNAGFLLNDWDDTSDKVRRRKIATFDKDFLGRSEVEVVGG